MVVKHKQTWERENKLKREPGFRKAIKYLSICVPDNQLDEAIGKSSRYMPNYSRHLKTPSKPLRAMVCFGSVRVLG
jgi:hypothetical protein